MHSAWTIAVLAKFCLWNAWEKKEEQNANAILISIQTAPNYLIELILIGGYYGIING